MSEAALDLSTLEKPEKQELLQLLEERARREKLKSNTCVGFVHPKDGFLYALKKDKHGQWQRSDEKPEVYLPAKLEPLLTRPKRFNLIIGGRGSGKSIGAGDICLIDAQDELAKTYCLREYQSSIKASVHSLLKDEIDRMDWEEHFEIQSTSISYKGREAFEFAGIARNTDSIKSAHGFKRFLIEEAQFLTTESLRALTPTVRNKPNKGLPGDIGEALSQSNVSMTFVANPASSEDPFSQKFIMPYLADLERDGIYEDDLRLIIVMNYTDNPWFHESDLEAERADDFETLPRALYDHIWMGKFNDSVDNALIMSEWFDACIDAHVKLGFEPLGAKIGSHDPSDMGRDSKGYAARHGSVVFDVQEKLDGNVNVGGHWAADLAIGHSLDYFSWDGDGMGAGLAEQMSRDCEGKKIDLSMFKGSEGPDYPEAIYKPAVKESVSGQKKNKEVFKNKRAQYYFILRDRIYTTYRAIVFGEYTDPDTMISFSSDMKLLPKLRAELCRIPKKPNRNGLNELYTKPEMQAKFKIPSPNLGDPVMMFMRYMPTMSVENVHIPSPISPMK